MRVAFELLGILSTKLDFLGGTEKSQCVGGHEKPRKRSCSLWLPLEGYEKKIGTTGGRRFCRVGEACRRTRILFSESFFCGVGQLFCRTLVVVVRWYSVVCDIEGLRTIWTELRSFRLGGDTCDGQTIALWSEYRRGEERRSSDSSDGEELLNLTLQYCNVNDRSLICISQRRDLRRDGSMFGCTSVLHDKGAFLRRIRPACGWKLPGKLFKRIAKPLNWSGFW